MTNDVKYSIIVPVYNEETVIWECWAQLKKVMDTLHEDYEIIFVNDGSRDKTPDHARQICTQDSRVRYVGLSRNFGHQAAISAGMEYAGGNAIIVIDADLQDPPSAILDMIAKWKEGYDVVYGKRIMRKGETIFKRFSAFLFYRFLQTMTSISIPADVGDFRLIDRKVCDVLVGQIHEKNRFVRGIVSWIGFKQTSVEYVREQRFAGETKYPLGKMLRFALDAIISFSHKPLKLATYLGVFASFAGFVYLCYAVYLKMFTDATIQGWTSLVVLSLLFNGIILIVLGIIGEYIGRIYDETKQRPFYIVKDHL